MCHVHVHPPAVVAPFNESLDLDRHKPTKQINDNEQHREYLYNKVRLTIRVELNVRVLAGLDTGISLGAGGDTLDRADDLALGVGFACNQLGVVIALGIDDLKEAGVGGLIGLLDGGSIGNLLDLGVCDGHVDVVGVYDGGEEGM